MTTHTQATGDVPQCPACGQYVYDGTHYCRAAQAPAWMAYGHIPCSEQVRAALTRIAADHEETATGHRKRMTRDEMVTLARQVCLEMGWEWSRKHA